MHQVMAGTQTTTVLPSHHHQPWRAPTREAALPLHVQSLERALDVNVLVNQVEHLLWTAVEEGSVDGDARSRRTLTESKKTLLTTKSVWEDERARKRDLSGLYNFRTLGKRKWLKNVLLEESDSDSDVEQTITDRDLKILLKIHKYRRKYQKRYHTDILNSQYTYFGAGLLSEIDRFPEHQKFILREYGFDIPSGAVGQQLPGANWSAASASPSKRSPLKRGRDSHRTSGLHGKTTRVTAQGGGNGQPSSSSEFNSPISSPRSLVKQAGATGMETKWSAAVTAGVPTLIKPPLEPTAGDYSPEASRWRAWRAIVIEDVPKAYTERMIQRKYQSVVLKQMALYCLQFLEQSREAAVSGKRKGTSRHGKKQPGANSHGTGWRPVNKNHQGNTSSK